MPQSNALTDEQIGVLASSHTRSVEFPTRYVLESLAFARAIEAEVRAALSQPSPAVPVLYVSPEQLEAVTDPDGDHGCYLPVRKHVRGKFTQALYAAPQPTEPVIPPGYVRADESMDVDKLYDDVRDLWAEANAVDTVIGRPKVFMTKLTQLRDAIGKARNGRIPYGTQPTEPAQPAQPAHIDNAPLGFTLHEKSAWSVGYEEGRDAATAQPSTQAGAWLPLLGALVCEAKSDAYGRKERDARIDGAHQALFDALKVTTSQPSDAPQQPPPAEQGEDAARLDWVFRQGEEFRSFLLTDHPEAGDYVVWGDGERVWGKGKTPREALDAARAAQAQKGQTQAAPSGDAA